MIEELKEFLQKLRAEYPYRVMGDYDTYGEFNMAWDHCIQRIEDWIDAREREQTAESGAGEPCVSVDEEDMVPPFDMDDDFSARQEQADFAMDDEAFNESPADMFGADENW